MNRREFITNSILGLIALKGLEFNNTLDAKVNPSNTNIDLKREIVELMEKTNTGAICYSPKGWEINGEYLWITPGDIEYSEEGGFGNIDRVPLEKISEIKRRLEESLEENKRFHFSPSRRVIMNVWEIRDLSQYG